MTDRCGLPAVHEHGGAQRDPAGAAGAGDVRSHRRRLRRHELGHDRRPAPPLARARGGPRAAAAGRSRARRGDGEFDAATVGFGARNFGDLERGLGEMARVVRPGGRVVVLEITTPTRRPLAMFFSLWFDRIVPLVGRLAADPEAYSYLPSSVKRFPGPERPPGSLAGAGPLDRRG